MRRGCVVDAVDRVLDGELDRAFCLQSGRPAITPSRTA